MAKKIKKISAKKVTHKTDWKFVITLVVLAFIAVGVFSIYRKLTTTNPESYWNFFYEQQHNSQNNNTNGGYGGSKGEANQRWNDRMNLERQNRNGGRGSCAAGYTWNSRTGSCNRNGNNYAPALPDDYASPQN